MDEFGTGGDVGVEVGRKQQQQQQQQMLSNKDTQVQYVTELRASDVLFGRGSGPNDHEGNVCFRALVLERKAEYMATNHRQTKAKIARDIVDIVYNANGRFLKKLEPKDTEKLGFPPDVDLYEVADEDTTMEKAKQALRQNTQRAHKSPPQAPTKFVKPQQQRQQSLPIAPYQQFGVPVQVTSANLQRHRTHPIEEPSRVVFSSEQQQQQQQQTPTDLYENLDPIPLPLGAPADIHPSQVGSSNMGPPVFAAVPSATTAQVWLENRGQSSPPRPTPPPPPTGPSSSLTFSSTASNHLPQEIVEPRPLNRMNMQSSMTQLPCDDFDVPSDGNHQAFDKGNAESIHKRSLQMSDLMDSFQQLKTSTDPVTCYNRSNETMGTIDAPMSVGSMNDMSLGDSCSLFDGMGATPPTFSRGSMTKDALSKTLSSASDASLRFQEIWSRRPNGVSAQAPPPSSYLVSNQNPRHLQSEMGIPEATDPPMNFGNSLLGTSIMTMDHGGSSMEPGGSSADSKKYFRSSDLDDSKKYFRNSNLDDSMTMAQQFLTGSVPSNLRPFNGEQQPHEDQLQQQLSYQKQDR